MEIWDLLDKDGNKTGETIEKTNLLPSGLYHLGVDVWIKNDDGKYLIQKRSMMKKRMPGMWMATGGSVLSGESGSDAVIRESFEELGIEVDTSMLKFLFRNRLSDCINEVWILHQNIEISSINMQLDEVSEVKWVKKEDSTAMIASGTMIDYGSKYIKIVFEGKRAEHIMGG